ncbi:unnamed protein product [Triticum turgidum subsp. durum]|uniref:Uncharacterized protein n=1 Tax=Triticum turgidum subsp. durum TaxID=4567 RepID=A0A9R0VS99_TRITD|nr:unnamed protein product [Triticum turgidum subsp. durum]
MGTWPYGDLATTHFLKFIDENAEEHDSGSDDEDSTSEQESEGSDAVSAEISSLKIVDQDPAGVPDLVVMDSDKHETLSKEHATSTSPSGENKSTDPTDDGIEDPNGAESGGDDDDDSSEDTEDEDDALLTKQLNKQRKRAMAAALGRRRPLNSRNAYKDKGKGTMNSKIQRQACQW